MSDTPRTDAAAFEWSLDYDPHYDVVPTEFARQLERELAAMRQEAADRCLKCGVSIKDYFDCGGKPGCPSASQPQIQTCDHVWLEEPPSYCVKCGARSKQSAADHKSSKEE